MPCQPKGRRVEAITSSSLAGMILNTTSDMARQEKREVSNLSNGAESIFYCLES